MTGDENYGCLPGPNNFRRILVATQGDDMPFIADEPIDTDDMNDKILRGLADEERGSPEKLYQLPISGDWITIAQVTSIIAHRERYGTPPDVAVISARPGNEGESHSTIPCETYEQACEIRDRIAADRNALNR